MVSTSQKYPPISIDQSFSNTFDNIKLLDPHEPRRMLGAITAPDGNSRAQKETLLSKSRMWSIKMKSTYLNKYDVSLSFRQGLVPGIEYPVGVSLLSKSDCDEIMRPSIPELLHKLGFTSTLARDIIYGPFQYGGLGIPNLYVSQGIQKIQLCLGHLRKSDQTGNIIEIAIGVLQQEVGISVPVLESSYNDFEFTASHSWAKCLWQFLSYSESSIRIDNIWIPPPTYSNDVNIMDVVHTWDIPKEQIYKINLCRLAKRVYYLGDLLDTTKTRL